MTLAIDEAIYGPDHPEVAIDLNNLAGLLQSRRHYSEARRLLERALMICEQSLGSNHPDTRLVRENLAAIPGRRRWPWQRD
jgi:hypothetical protein